MCVPALLLFLGSTAQAATLWVHCGATTGLTSISAAIKALQSLESERPTNTINVSGACHDNVVIQSMDRLTLNAVNGASITDASGGTLDVIRIADSRGISINNFTINGGDNGIECSDQSACRLSGNTVQGANIGILANVLAQAVVSGGTARNNGVGLAILNGSNAQAGDTTIQNNALAIDVRFHSSLVTNATVTNNTVNGGAFVATNGTLHCNGCQFTGNGGGPAVLLRRDSSATFQGAYAITGNSGGGVLITEVSSALFFPGAVVGNTGGLDVFCGASFTTGKGATINIGGGTTNCVEPPQ